MATLPTYDPNNLGSNADARRNRVIADLIGDARHVAIGASSPIPAAAAVVDCLIRAGDYAARHGIILGLENHGGITTRAAPDDAPSRATSRATRASRPKNHSASSSARP